MLFPSGILTGAYAFSCLALCQLFVMWLHFMHIVLLCQSVKSLGSRAELCMTRPAGMWVKGLDQEALPGVIAAVVSQPTDDNPDFTPPPLKKSVQSAARSTPPLSLFV